MSRLSHILFCSIVLFLIAGVGHTQEGGIFVPEEQSTTPYYKDAKKGWYWYEKEVEKLKEGKREEKEVKKEEPAKQHRTPSLKDYTDETLWNMHPDDFQPLLMDFQKKAVMNPSEDNIMEYYHMQDIARRKALAFANVTASVMQKNPELSLAKDYPTVTPGRNALTRQTEDEVAKRIEAAKNNYGLIFFYSPTCEYCMEQARIIDYFEKRYRWEVKKIDISENQRVVVMFSVTTVPYILLVYQKSSDAIPISTGVISLDDMVDKIYRGVRLLSGEITPEEYSIYDFQKKGAFDVKAPLNREKEATKGGR